MSYNRAAANAAAIDAAANAGLYTIQFYSESNTSRLANDIYVTSAIKTELEIEAFTVTGVDLDPSTSTYNFYVVTWS